MTYKWSFCFFIDLWWFIEATFPTKRYERSTGICPQSTDNWAISLLEVIFESQMGAIDVIFGWEKRCKSNRETEISRWFQSEAIKLLKFQWFFMIAKSIEKVIKRCQKVFIKTKPHPKGALNFFGRDHDFYTNFGDSSMWRNMLPSPKKMPLYSCATRNPGMVNDDVWNFHH